MRPLLLGAVMVAAACSPAGPADPVSCPAPARILVAGPLRFDAEVAAISRADPEGVLRDVRFVVSAADLAVGSVSAGSGAEARDLLAAAGFDLVIEGAGPPPGVSEVEAGGVGVAVVAILGPALGRPTAAARLGALVAETAGRADVTVIYLGSSRLDSGRLAGPLAALGADVVVGAGDAGDDTARLVGDVLVVPGSGPLLTADRSSAGTLTEFLASGCGVTAYRVGRHQHDDLRVHFEGWVPPPGDAALIDGEWWAIAAPVATEPARQAPSPAGFTAGDLEAASVGDVTGDGVDDIAAAYRHPATTPAPGEELLGPIPVDGRGRTAHVGVFAADWSPIWRASRIPHPIGDLAACDGAVALAFTDLNGADQVGVGAAVWDGFGLVSAPELPGLGTPACADLDGDRRLEAVIVDRPGVPALRP